MTGNTQRLFTWFHLQRATVDLDVEPLGRGAAEVLQHAVNGLGHVVRHRLVQLHPAVHHHAAVPEVEDFQLLESGQIGLKIRQKLRRGMSGGKQINLNSIRVLSAFYIFQKRRWRSLRKISFCAQRGDTTHLQQGH